MRSVLHYTGYDRDAGGILAVIRALAATGECACTLGVNPGFAPSRTPPLPLLELPAIAGEKISLATLWRARAVAARVAAWLGEDPQRIYHGHSRAGLLVGLWLHRRGVRRLVVSVHCYGRQKWFYRWAARQLGERLFWLSPAMKRHYGVTAGHERGTPGDWSQCIPSCIPPPVEVAPLRPRPPSPSGRLHLGGIGGLVPVKRWDLVLAALAALPSATRAKLRFTHIGGEDGSAESQRYARHLRAQTTALGLTDLITWRGEQPSSRELLREVDAVVVPAAREAFSLAMLEALAAGVPVLAADSGGPSDVLVPERNGWLFTAESETDLARQLARLTAGDALARVRIEPGDTRRFTAPVVAAQWREVYARVAGATESSAVLSAAR